MKCSVTIVGLFALVASVYCSVYPVLPAASLIRSPQHDSTVVRSENLNGNFAYSTVEGHAYQTVHPVYHHPYHVGYNLYQPQQQWVIQQHPQYIPQQYPQYIPQQPSVVTYPGLIPQYPTYYPSYVPIQPAGGVPVRPINETPIEVESEADNREDVNEDNDSVSVESAI
ncbi:unnamed protein product [Diamesa serratosioi]